MNPDVGRDVGQLYIQAYPRHRLRLEKRRRTLDAQAQLERLIEKQERMAHAGLAPEDRRQVQRVNSRNPCDVVTLTQVLADE